MIWEVWATLFMGLTSGFYCGWVARETKMLRDDEDRDDVS